MKKLAFFLFLALAFAMPSMGQTLALNPIADSFVSSANPNNNYGAAGSLEVSATGSAKGIFDSLMQFNLSGATGWYIQSISLQLVAANPVNGLFNSSTAGQFSVVWMQNSGWTEGSGTPMASSTNGGITYNTLPGYLGSSDETVGTFSFSGATSGTNTYSLQLTPGFLNAVTTGSDVSLEIVPADDSVSYLFNSNNFTNASARPLLTVTAVPEPAALAASVLLPALALAASSRRGRRRG